MAAPVVVEHHMEIQTFVIFKVETTDRPWDGGLPTKIAELCCVVVPRKMLESEVKLSANNLNQLVKFHHVINPERYVGQEASQSTGLYSDIWSNSFPTFSELYENLVVLLQGLPKPVCLIAHVGNAFDFKMLRFECNEIKKQLPEDLLCVDSLFFFRKLLRGVKEEGKCQLPNLYRRYQEIQVLPQGAEQKARMLLECILLNNEFMAWADNNCKSILTINPFYDGNRRGPRVDLSDIESLF